MTIAITCHGCGKRFEVPDDYERRKVRCAECGVYCELPEPAKRSSSAKPASEPAKKTGTAKPVTKPESKPSRPAAKVDDIFADAYREDSVAKPVPKAAKSADPMPKAPPPEAIRVRDEDDGQMYQFADKDVVKCPDCNKELPPETKLCPRCGFNLETGQKAVKVYTEVTHTWEAGWPLERRVKLYVIGQAVILPLDLFFALYTGMWGAFLTPWFFFTFLLTFVLGTFDRLDLTRDKKGRVRLTRTWRIFFFAREPQVIPLREYEGVATGPADKNVMDWIVCLFLLPAGIVPAILWFYFVVIQSNFHVSLTQHHGFPELPLYRGSNQARVREIADTLHEIAGLPYAG